MITEIDKNNFLTAVKSYDSSPSKTLAIEIFQNFIDLETEDGKWIFKSNDEGFISLKEIIDQYKLVLAERDRTYSGFTARFARYRTAAGHKAAKGIFAAAVSRASSMGFMTATPTRVTPKITNTTTNQVMASLRGRDNMAIMSKLIADREDNDKIAALARLEDFTQGQLGGSRELLDMLIKHLQDESRITMNFNARFLFSLSLAQIGDRYKNIWELKHLKTDKYLADRDKVETAFLNVGTLLQSKPATANWRPDSTVNVCQHMYCKRRLSMGFRHHCRLCGGLFCQQHSSKTLNIFSPLTAPGKSASGLAINQRVCDVCFESSKQSLNKGILENEIVKYGWLGSPDFNPLFRPQYAALDFLKAKCGAANMYGRSFFELEKKLMFNSTFSHSDTFDKSQAINPTESLANWFNFYPLVTNMPEIKLGQLIAATLEPNATYWSPGWAYDYLECQIQSDLNFRHDIKKMHISRAELEWHNFAAIPLEDFQDLYDAKVRLGNKAGTSQNVYQKIVTFARLHDIKLEIIEDADKCMPSWDVKDTALPAAKPWSKT